MINARKAPNKGSPAKAPGKPPPCADKRPQSKEEKRRTEELRDLLCRQRLFFSNVISLKNASLGPKRRIVAWFRAKSVEERARVLTFHDPAFVNLVTQMGQKHTASLERWSRRVLVQFLVFEEMVLRTKPSRRTSKAHDFKIPTTSFPASVAFEDTDPFIVNYEQLSPTPQNDFVYATSGPSKLKAFDTILDNFHVSHDFSIGLCTETFVGNFNGFLKSMNMASEDHFLLEPMDYEKSTLCLPETRWLKGMGRYSLAQFLANKVETLLWRAWWEEEGGKGQQRNSGSQPVERFLQDRVSMRRYLFSSLQRQESLQTFTKCAAKAIKCEFTSKDSKQKATYQHEVKRLLGLSSCMSEYLGLASIPDVDYAKGHLKYGPCQIEDENGVLDKIMSSPVLLSRSIHSYVRKRLYSLMTDSRFQYNSAHLLNSISCPTPTMKGDVRKSSSSGKRKKKRKSNQKARSSSSPRETGLRLSACSNSGGPADRRYEKPELDSESKLLEISKDRPDILWSEREENYEEGKEIREFGGVLNTEEVVEEDALKDGDHQADERREVEIGSAEPEGSSDGTCQLLLSEEKALGEDRAKLHKSVKELFLGMTGTEESASVDTNSVESVSPSSEASQEGKLSSISAAWGERAELAMTPILDRGEKEVSAHVEPVKATADSDRCDGIASWKQEDVVCSMRESIDASLHSRGFVGSSLQVTSCEVAGHSINLPRLMDATTQTQIAMEGPSDGRLMDANTQTELGLYEAIGEEVDEDLMIDDISDVPEPEEVASDGASFLPQDGASLSHGDCLHVVNVALRDMCLQLESEVATLRSILATERGMSHLSSPTAMPFSPHASLNVPHLVLSDFPYYRPNTRSDSLPMEIMSDDGRGTVRWPYRQNSKGSLVEHMSFPHPPPHPRVSSTLKGSVLMHETVYESRPEHPLRRIQSESFPKEEDNQKPSHTITSPKADKHSHYVEDAHGPPSGVDSNLYCNGFGLNTRCLRLRSRLCDDVLLFVDYVVKVAEARLPGQNAAIVRCRNVVESLWPRAQVKAYGSFVTGLYLPSSDVDLVICLPKVRKDAPAEAPGALEGRNAIKETWQQNLARSLRKTSWVEPSSIKIISHTIIPVIKVETKSNFNCLCPTSNNKDEHLSLSALTDEPKAEEAEEDIRLSSRIFDSDLKSSPIYLDISFEGSNHNGLQANRFITSLIAETPAIRPLVLVLKQFLKERGLLESYSGGLSSYGLVLMVARYLQEQSQTMDTGSLLMGFLDFYSNHFDPRSIGVSVSRRCFFSREHATMTSGSIPVVRGQPLPSYFPSPPTPGDRRRPYNNNTTGGTAEPQQQPQWETMQLKYKFDPLYIEDPRCPTNNVGRNCFRIFQIQRAWQDAWRTLKEAVSENAEEMEQRDPYSLPLLSKILCFHVPTT